MQKIVALCVVLCVSHAEAGSITPGSTVISGCVKLGELPDEWYIESAEHIRSGAYENTIPGCNSSTPSARPTGGTYRLSFANGLHRVTFRREWFNPFCPSQNDNRTVGGDGAYTGFFDFTVDPETTDMSKCWPSNTPAPSQSEPLLVVIPPSGGEPPSFVPSFTPPGEPPVNPTPVPEPATIVLVGAGLLAAAWRRRR